MCLSSGFDSEYAVFPDFPVQELTLQNLLIVDWFKRKGSRTGKSMHKGKMFMSSKVCSVPTVSWIHETIYRQGYGSEVLGRKIAVFKERGKERAGKKG